MRGSADMVLILVRMGGSDVQHWAGASLGKADLVSVTRLGGVHGRIEGPSHTIVVLCETASLLRFGHALVGRQFTLPDAIRTWQPAPEDLQTFVSLLRGA